MPGEIARYNDRRRAERSPVDPPELSKLLLVSGNAARASPADLFQVHWRARAARVVGGRRGVGGAEVYRRGARAQRSGSLLHAVCGGV